MPPSISKFKFLPQSALTFVPFRLDEGRLDVCHGRARFLTERLDELELIGGSSSGESKGSTIVCFC